MFSIRRMAWAVLCLASPFFLHGCASKQTLPELPQAIGDKGLLVARLYILGMQSMENASVNIDGRVRSSALRDGYIAIPLEPGDHQLVALRAEGRQLASAAIEEESPFRKVRGGGGGGSHYIYVPGGSYTIYYTTLAVDRSFHIEPGKVTNLGLIVYIPVRDDPSKKRATVNDSRQFNVVALDNSSELKTFLATNYPELVSTLSSPDISLAPAKYFDVKLLPDLRRVIAYYESSGPHRVVTASATAVYGRAGTVAILKKPDDGRQPSPRDVEIVDTGTLADIVGAVPVGDGFTFLTSDGELLSLNGATLGRTRLPYRIQPVSLHALGKTGMVIVDNHMRMLTTRSPGDKWVSFDDALDKTPRTDIDVVADDDGVYVSLGRTGLPSSLYYVKADESIPSAIPTAIRDIPGTVIIAYHSLVARDVGLFVMFSGPDFYFWSKTTRNWELRSLPPGHCQPVQFDDTGRNLSVECGGIIYGSGDSGASWTKPHA